ncbi:uncharacterized protein nin isoform 3-T3 [Menidia menidia]
MTLQECIGSSLAERNSHMEVSLGTQAVEIDASTLFGRVLSCGMDDSQEQDHYEERLKEVFHSFDTSGCGSLNPEELSDLCQSLHLDDATPALLQTLLQNQDSLTGRVDFNQFKDALILVLSSTIEPSQAEEETVPEPDSPEIQPKFVKGGKRYGRRSTPEFIEPVSELSDIANLNPADEEDLEDNCDSAIPRKRERWNGDESSTEEYEAEGQMHLWNPDEPRTPRGSSAPLSARSDERLREACEELGIPWDGGAGHSELRALCEHLGLELNGDVLLSLTGDGVMNVQEFVSRVVNNNTPPTPSASTPYRQFKRHHSTQPFDEGGRRTSALTGTIGMRLFSTLDDGTGYTPAEHILDVWIDEGIENSAEILQALNFDLDGKLSLGDLTTALENELLVTKNGIHQAALASFKAEIRHLLERVDREIREKEKIRSDLEKAEKQKAQLATEVDEHHSAIEHTNNLNLRKLEQEHKEKLAAVQLELRKEMDQIQQQAGLQREELELEIEKIREDESFLRDHLSITVKENRRLEMELLDNADKLAESEQQITKLQSSLDNIMKNKVGDMDPGSGDFFLQEERIKQLRSGYETQCRELQDRIDELQSELREFHALGRSNDPCHKTLSDELESKSPGTESDPGLGSEEVQPFSISLEAELMLEQLKDQHLQEMEDLRKQLECKINEFDIMAEEQRSTYENQKAALTLQYQQDVRALTEEMASVQRRTQELESQLEQAELERTCLEQKQGDEWKELQNQQEDEVGTLREQLLEARGHCADLEEQMKTLEVQQAETDENLLAKIEELKNQHSTVINKLKEEHEELLEARLTELRNDLQEEKAELERKLLDEWEMERKALEQSHEAKLNAQLEEAKLRYEEERDEVVKRLTEQWQKERAQLDEQNNESLQVLLEEEMLRLVREQEEKESQLREQWERERAQLQELHDQALLDRILEERSQLQEQFELREKRLKEDWEKEKLQLEEDYEGMIQDRLNEEREKLEGERDDEEKRVERLIAEERAQLEENHRAAMKELSTRHAEERDALSAALDRLRVDITKERQEVELSFTKRIREVEDRFSGDQESVAERFQADVLKLEQYYQSELKSLSESHGKQRLHWEAEMQKALEFAEEERRATEEAMKEEKEASHQEWEKEKGDLESAHSGKVEALMMEIKRLQGELDELMSTAQSKEIELSMQLNELHSRLQEKHELLAQAESKALQTELLLNQTVEDFKQERAEFLATSSSHEAKMNEMLSMAERQASERIQLLTERDDLKRRVEELEMVLRQAAVDFELERQELQESLSTLEMKLKEFDSERDLLQIKIKELEKQLDQLSAPAEKTVNDQMEGWNDSAFIEGTYNAKECISVSAGETPQVLLDEDVHVILIEAEDGDGFINADRDDQQQATESRDPRNEDVGSGEGCHDEVDIIPNHMSGDPSLEKGEMHEDSDQDSGSPDSYLSIKSEALSPEMLWEPVSSLEAFGEGENKVALDARNEDGKPQNVPAVEFGSCSHEDGKHHETAVVAFTLEEAGDPGEESVEDTEVGCLPVLDCEHSAADLQDENHHECAHDCGEHPDGDSDRENRDSPAELQALYSTATEENVLLREKISLLQQKTEILENLVGHHSEKMKAGHQALEENYSLKVQMLLLVEHVKELETKALEMNDLQIRYEDCQCENAKLKEQNGDLEKRVWSLEGRINVFHDFQDQHISLVDEIARIRGENAQLFLLLSELERQDGLLPALPEVQQPDGPTDEAFTPLSGHLQADARMEDCCKEFERQNTKLRRAITELQDESHTLNETTQAYRSEAGRLAEENLTLRQKIMALKEGDLKETQHELLQTVEHLKMEKFAAQKAAVHFKKQISDLHMQSQQLEVENGTLTERNAQNVADVENLQQQLVELAREKAEEKNKAVRVDSMENQLSHLVEERKGVDKETVGLRSQLAKANEKVKTVDESFSAVNRQSTRLKSDLRVLQQERDSLKHEVAVLHKQLQNANDKNHILEMALHSSGLQNQSKKLYREEMSRLMEQEQQLLRQENERLQAEVCSVKGDLFQSREKVRQLDATVLSLNKLKQQSQSSQVKALEMENSSLKQELDAKREQTKGCESGQSQTELEGLQHENEALKAQMARLSTQLLESFQAQLVGLLPPSPHRVPRGQHHGEDPDNMQDERERKMRNMEGRMREIELSLHNVKLLLKEKVAQLKDQLHKNGKADVLIKDLYVENAQLLKALEMTEQRQKIAEKKNYLLEEKISSLNKIVRDLNPSTLPLLPYSYKSP